MTAETLRKVKDAATAFRSLLLGYCSSELSSAPFIPLRLRFQYPIIHGSWDMRTQATDRIWGADLDISIAHVGEQASCLCISPFKVQPKPHIPASLRGFRFGLHPSFPPYSHWHTTELLGLSVSFAWKTDCKSYVMHGWPR